MDMTDNKDKEDWKLLKAAAMKLKTMAQQLDLVVIMIAQLNKSGNLAQASQMDQEADLWLNLTRVRDEEQLGKMYPFNAIAYVNKARNAENEVALPLLFTGDTLTFISNKEEAEQWQRTITSRRKRNMANRQAYLRTPATASRRTSKVLRRRRQRIIAEKHIEADEKNRTKV